MLLVVLAVFEMTSMLLIELFALLKTTMLSVLVRAINMPIEIRCERRIL
jgi:hypothetical protein